MATLTTQVISQAGMTPALQAASAGGDQWTPGTTTFLLAKNGDTAPHTITIHTTAVAFGQPISNIAVPIPAGAEVMLGPFDPGEVAQPGTNLANLTYDAVTSMSIAAIRCPSI